MKRVVMVLVFLGILGLASGSASAHDYGNWHSNCGYYGYHHPHHHGYYVTPQVVVRPTVVVPAYPGYYGSCYQPSGCVPYNYGTLQVTPRGLSLRIGF
jgi:hypothetical protein